MTAPAPSIEICRVYDANAAVGARLLVDRLWPRGVSKTALKLGDWLKDAAPSNKLRRWFDHEPAKRAQFSERYSAEYDPTYNHAVVLRDYLIKHTPKDHHAR